LINSKKSKQKRSIAKAASIAILLVVPLLQAPVPVASASLGEGGCDTLNTRCAAAIAFAKPLCVVLEGEFMNQKGQVRICFAVAGAASVALFYGIPSTGAKVHAEIFENGKAVDTDGGACLVAPFAWRWCDAKVLTLSPDDGSCIVARASALVEGIGDPVAANDVDRFGECKGSGASLTEAVEAYGMPAKHLTEDLLATANRTLESYGLCGGTAFQGWTADVRVVTTGEGACALVRFGSLDPDAQASVRAAVADAVLAALNEQGATAPELRVSIFAAVEEVDGLVNVERLS
jgi:hypothetical protein